MNNNNIFLFYEDEKQIRKIDDINIILDDIYFEKARLPTINELKQLSEKSPEQLQQNIKDNISQLTNKVPLYNIFNESIFLFSPNNMMDKIYYEEYLFPDINIVHEIKNKQEEYKDSKNKFTQYRYKKTIIQLKFLDNFNLEKMYKTFVKLFNEYNKKEIGLEITSCLKKSFLHNFYSNIYPFYKDTEIKSLAKNFGIEVKDNLSKYDFSLLCNNVREKEISARELLIHQKYIIQQDKVGLIQYYTSQGSFRINSYLRGTSKYEDKLLESIITELYKLVQLSPSFEKEYYFYRFIENDILKQYNVGDIINDYGFLSSTRDAFYTPSEHVEEGNYYFGKILLRIKIPKNIQGVALCVETLSNFLYEQEIIFSSNCKLKIISNSNQDYYYPSKGNEFENIKIYDLEWISNGKLQFSKKEKCKINMINIAKIIKKIKITSSNLEELISSFTDKYVSKNNRIDIKINKKIYKCYCERYDGTSVYGGLYNIKKKNGFSIYCINKNYVLFMIEIGDIDGRNILVYNHNFNMVQSDDITNDNILLLTMLGKMFNAYVVLIRPTYNICISSDSMFVKYCDDIYQYLKYGTKKYENYKNIKCLFSYDELNKLKNEKTEKILLQLDNDELYQIQKYDYDDDDNIASFYCWIVENYCYLINLLQTKMNRLFDEKTNPFKTIYYRFDI